MSTKSRSLRRVDYERVLDGLHHLYRPDLSWTDRVLLATHAAFPGLRACATNGLVDGTYLDPEAALRPGARRSTSTPAEYKAFVREVIARDPDYTRAHGLLWEGRTVINQDVMSLGEIAGREAHERLYRTIDAKFQIGFPVWRNARRLTFVNALRGDAPFTERERAIADLLREHIARARPLLPDPGPAPRLPPRLTPRQAEVLQWLAEGKRDAEIAVILGAGVRTVNHHVAAILRSLGVENRAAAMVLARELYPDGAIPASRD